MQERRNSVRMPLAAKVRELNGEYLFSWGAINLSEEGVFLLNKSCFNSQDHHSKLSFTLPDGTHLDNVTARIVRESRKGLHPGCAFEFLNLSEEHRIALKRCLMAQAS
ncbi:MAG: PilZ domain-containing protein [Bdellovibrionota bacterium]